MAVSTETHVSKSKGDVIVVETVEANKEFQSPTWSDVNFVSGPMNLVPPQPIISVMKKKELLIKQVNIGQYSLRNF